MPDSISGLEALAMQVLLESRILRQLDQAKR
jgi:hypothetical protein